MLSLMEYLNNQGKYRCLYINVESAQAARGNVEKGIQSILNTLAKKALFTLKDPFMNEIWKKILDESGELDALKDTLSQWSQNDEKPVVLLIDEIDSLVGDTLISVLRQLRSGYPDRPLSFPQSIILCGVRDVRDYRIYSNKEQTIVTGGSAFNIKTKSLRIGNFNIEEIRSLYLQHTKETGQVFNEAIFPLVWELTEGQPWLVNALGYEVCFEIEEGLNRKKEIDADMILQAKENLILQRATHLDQLSDKLKEERVRMIIRAILEGREAIRVPMDDIDYVVEIGLVKKDRQIRISNQIYLEFILKYRKDFGL